MRRQPILPMVPWHPRLGVGDLFVGFFLVTLLFGLILIASRIGGSAQTPEISLSPLMLPLYALLSVLRMTAAYFLSLVFTLVYGYVARLRHAEAVLIPLLDILQSVPVLSFLPAVVLALISLFPGRAGVELASILLVFTGQVWNMTFSFYNSLITVPKELNEAATVLKLNWWMRLRKLEIPFATTGLVWNSIMSWAGGWFFLMATEQFALGPREFRLPGLGSYLQAASNAGNLRAIFWGLVALVGTIVLLDQIVWRPLLSWADRFRGEALEVEGSRPWMAVILSRSATVQKISEAFQRLGEWLDRLLGAPPAPHPEERRPGRWQRVPGLVLLFTVAAAVVAGTVGAAGFLVEVSVGEWGVILLGALATTARVFIALALALAWTVPAGVAIGLNEKLAVRLQPAVQVVASIPATGFFPVLLFLLLTFSGGLNIAAVLLMLFALQWYLLFNVIAGTLAIPRDLRQVAATLRLRRWHWWRAFILPAIFPYLVTGVVTATGAAWNASIVAERVQFAGSTFQTLGIGAIIAASSEQAQFGLLLASTLTLVVLVVLINRVIWRRLYRLGAERFRYD